MPPFDVRHRNVADPVYAQVSCCTICRHPATYDEVIDQFEVESNPRYTPRDTSGDGGVDTHCDAFVHDVTRAMGCEVPNWWRGRELSANGMIDWLLQTGLHFGWEQVTAAEALAAASRGQPALAAWRNPSGPGHVAIVRPGPAPMTLAQAGRQCLSRASLAQCFGTKRIPDVRFFIHP